MKQPLLAEFELFVIALQFLTRLPVGTHIAFSTAKVGNSAAYYPLVGACIGAAGGLCFMAFAWMLPAHVAVWLTVGLLLLATGCLHEDDFADMCDGLGGGVDKNAALTIMRDSRLGTYAVASLFLLLGTKVASLTAFAPSVVPLVLIAGHCLSRLSAVVVMLTSDYVRSAGVATQVSAGISHRRLVLVALTALLASLLVVMVLGVSATLGMWAGCVAGHLLTRRVFEKKLGGYTGDCLGATQQVSETGIYLGLLICI
jgi:adenosylcobinamide-GDP ribazoletransferase